MPRNYYTNTVSKSVPSRTRTSAEGAAKITRSNEIQFSAMVNQKTSVVKCCHLLAMVLVFISSEVNCQKGILDKNNGIMIPNVKQQEVRSGTRFTITCMFVHTTTIEWKLPDYLTRYKDVS